MFTKITRRHSPQKLILLALDMLAVVLSVISVLLMRYNSDLFPPIQSSNILLKFLIYSLSSLVLVILFRHFTLYKPSIYLSTGKQVIQVVKGWFGTVLFLILTLFFLRGELIVHSRFLVISYSVLLLAVLLTFRLWLFKFISKHIINEKIKASRTLIIGTGNAATQIISRIIATEDMSTNVVGLITNNGNISDTELFGIPILGRLDKLNQIAENVGASQIIIALEKASYDEMLEIMDIARDTKLPIGAYSDHFKIVLNDQHLREYSNLDIVNFPNSIPTSVIAVRFKRILDFSLALFSIILFAPIYVILMLLVKLTSKGPIFYSTEAIGRNGQIFKLFKFRTMKVNSDDNTHREHVTRLIKDGNAVASKMKNDNRITKVGSFLRRHSLDETPQLLNVLRGEMSLVGPRPCLSYEYELYEKWQKKRAKIMPGITGLWQVSGRSSVSINDMIALDLYYIDNYSVWLDFQILFRTIWVVLGGKGGK